MTADELRAAGRSDAYISAYLAKGRELDSMSLPVLAEVPAPEPSETEKRAAVMADRLATESALLDQRKAAVSASDAVSTAVVERPGEPREQTTAEKREAALQWAIRQGYAVTRPGGDPVRNWVMQGPSGPVIVRSAEPPAPVVILPQDWNRADRVWQRKLREEQDSILRQACPPAWWPDLDVEGDPADYRPPMAGTEAL